MIQKFISFTVALALCATLSVSCEKETTGSSKKDYSETNIGEIISTGTCNAFNVSTEGARMCYLEDEDVYFLDFFYGGEGTFGFKWDKSTNIISLIETETGLFFGMYPVDFLSQEDYEKELGADAKKSWYDPATDTFTFNILYQTAVSDGQVVHTGITITYKPKAQ